MDRAKFVLNAKARAAQKQIVLACSLACSLAGCQTGSEDTSEFNNRVKELEIQLQEAAAERAAGLEAQQQQAQKIAELCAKAATKDEKIAQLQSEVDKMKSESGSDGGSRDSLSKASELSDNGGPYSVLCAVRYTVM